MTHLLSTYAPYPFEVVKANGCYIYDKSGNQYLDLYGGHCVALLGHNPKIISDALIEQSQQIFFYSMAANIPIREEAAKSLAQYTPKSLQKFFFCNSGAEANENALKLCIQKKQRKKLLAFKGGWHGRSLFCMSVTDDKAWHQSLLGWNGPVDFLELNNIESLDKITDEVAGVILEPIQSIGGINVANNDFLKALRAQCSKVGAWLIFDEIQTGIGRTGKPFVAESCGVTPDMMTMAKGLASGFPLAALAVSEEVEKSLKPGDLGSTYGAGPMAMAALKASFDHINKIQIHNHAEKIGEYAKKTLSKLPMVSEVRGSGLLLGLLLDKSAKEYQSKLLDKKILTGTSGHPNVLRLLPPLIIDESHIDQLAQNL